MDENSLFESTELLDIVNLLIGRTESKTKETIEDITLRHLIEVRVKRKLAKREVHHDSLHQVCSCEQR